MNVDEWLERMEALRLRLLDPDISPSERQRAVDRAYLLLRASARGRELSESELDREFFVPNPHEDVVGCRAAFLAIIRRAAEDWALYDGATQKRGSDGPNAYIWLFDEGPGHPWWEVRSDEERCFRTFLGICGLLDLEPERVREAVRRITTASIIGAGRPREWRNRVHHDDSFEELFREQMAFVGAPMVTAAPSDWDEVDGT